MKKILPVSVLTAIVIMFNVSLKAATIESASNGYWNSPGTWVGGAVPTSSDDVVIKPTHTVTLSDTRVCVNVTVDGTLTLASGGALNQTGTVTVPGTMNLNGGTVDFTTVNTSNGKFYLNSGTYTFGAGVNFVSTASFYLNSGSVTFDSGSTLSSSLSIQGGTFNDNVGIQPGAVTMSGGTTYQGSGSPTFANGFTWSGGTIKGSGNCSFTGVLNINGSGGAYLQDSRELHISNIMNWTYGYISMSGTAKIRVLGTGQVNANVSGQYISGTASNLFELQSGGSFTKSGSGNCSIIVPVISTGGSFTVSTGSLSFDGTSLTNSFTNTSITIDGSNTLSFAGNGTMIYNLTGSMVSGTGTLSCYNGTINIETGSSIASKLSLSNCTFNDNVGIQPGAVTMSNGTYQGSGSPTFANGFTWSSGTIKGSGNCYFTGVLNMNGSGLYLQDSRELHISNIMNWTSGNISMSGTSKIRVLGTGQVNANVSVQSIVGTASNLFELQSGGSFTRSGSSYCSITVPVISTGGSITVSTGSFSFSGTDLTHSFTNTSMSIANGTTLSFSGNGAMIFNVVGTSISGAGTLSCSVGTINIETGSSITSKLSLDYGNPTFNDNVGIQPGAVTMSGGTTYQGTGSPTFANGFTWSGGTIKGSGNCSFTGVLNISSSGYGLYLQDSRELHISNIMNWTNGNISMSGTAKIRVLGTGQVNASASGQYIVGTASNHFELQSGGSFTRSGGSYCSITVPVISTGGSITVSTGSLSFGGTDLTHSFTNSSITIDGSNTLSFTGNGTMIFNLTGSMVSGTGTLSISTVGTVNIETGSSIASKFTLSSGTFNDNVGIQPGAVTMSNGTYQGTGSPTFANGFTWLGGTMQGTGISTFSGVLNISNSISVKESRELHISNIMNWTNGNISMSGTSKIRVLGTGQVNANVSVQSIVGTASNLFELQSGGSFTKSGSSYCSIIVPVISTGGSITVSTGSLSFGGTDLTHSFTNTSMSIANGATLSFSGYGAMIFNVVGTSISGAGTLSCSVGTINIETGSSITSKLSLDYGNPTFNDNVGIQPGAVTMSSGTYQGSGSPTFANGFTWLGGTMQGTGISTFSGVLNISNSISVKESRELHISNIMNWTNGHISMSGTAKIRVLAGGTFLMTNGGTISGTVNNLFEVQSGGTINKSGGSHPISCPFLNAGTVNVNSSVLYIGQAATHSGVFNIVSGAQLNFTNTSTNTTLTGNVTNNGNIIVPGGRTLVFAGSMLQELAGNGSSITSLTLNNGSNLSITGSQIITSLALTTGKIILQDGDLNVVNLSGSDANRYFVTEGTGRLIMSVTNSPKVFDIGTSVTSYTPVTLQKTTGGTDYFAVRVQEGFDYPTGGNDYVDRQWTIDRTSGSGTVNVTLKWNSADEQGSFNSANCHVARWSGSSWNHFGDGPASCGSGSCTRTANAVANFSPFGVASYTTLPVELFSFNVVKSGSHNADLRWQTASEVNNKGFEIERSNDAKQWSNIAFVPSLAVNGHSNALLSYGYMDDHASSGVNYYRLKQIDTGGEFSYSEIRSVAFREEDEIILVYPNPAKELIKINTDDIENQDIAIFDYSGHAVQNYTIIGNDCHIKALPAGIYYVRITDKDSTKVRSGRFVKID